MADTTYTDNITVITADTMNDLNRLHYTILQDPTDLAALITRLASQAWTFAGNVTIQGNTVIGNASSDTLTFHPNAWTLTNNVTVTGTWTNLGTVSTVDINGGTIDGTTQATGTINGSIAAGGTWTAAATWTLPAFTLGGTVTLNGQSFSGTCANGGTFTTLDINGGTIDGTAIGGSTPAAGAFTTLSSTGNFTLNTNVAVLTAAAPANSLYLNGSGNLGLGTASPSTKLHLQDNSAVFIQMTDVGDGASRVGQNGTALTFGVDGADGSTERMRIDASGNVGIGTTTNTNSSRVYIEQPGNLRMLQLTATNADSSSGIGITNDARAWAIGVRGDLSDAFNIRDITGSRDDFLISSSGSVIAGAAAIATNATDGFLYVPSCAGTPTGVPTTYTGRVPIVVDSTNNKLYFYSGGAWRDAGP